MKRYGHEDPVVNQKGQPVNQATVTVYLTGTSTKASLYSDNIGTAMGNPLTTSSIGEYSFWIEDGVYDIVYSGGTPAITTETVYGVEIFDYKTKPVYAAHMYPAADAFASIQAAHDAAPSSGATIDCRGFPGTNAVTSALTITKDNITLIFGSDETFTLTPTGFYGIGTTADNTRIEGHGALFQASKAWADAGHYNIIEAKSCDGFNIDGARVQLTMTGTVPTVTQALVHGISVQNNITATYGAAPTNARIENCNVWVRGHVTDATVLTKQSAICVAGYGGSERPNGILIQNCYFDDSYGRNVYVYHCDNVVINRCITPNLGATLTNASDSGAKHVRVIACKNVVVSNCVAMSTGTNGFFRAYTIEGDGESENVIFANNTAYFSGTYDATGTAGSCAMLMDWAKGCRFTNNTLVYAGATGTQIDGIQIRDIDGAITHAEIDNNTIRDFPLRQFRIVKDTTDPTGFFRDNYLTGTSLFTIPATTTNFIRVDTKEGTTTGTVSRDYPHFSVAGYLAGSTASQTTNRLVRFKETYTDPSSIPYLVDVQGQVVATSGANAYGIRNANFIAQVASTNTQNITGPIVGLRAGVESATGATGTITAPTAIRISNTNAAGTWTTLYGVYVEAPTGAGTTSDKRSIYVESGGGKAYLTDGIIIGTTTNIYQGGQSSRTTVRGEVGSAGAIGSIYLSNTGKAYLKVANAGVDTDWERITTSAAD